MNLIPRFAKEDRAIQTKSRSPRPRGSALQARGGQGYSAESLERRVLLSTVPVTVNVAEILQLRNPDSFPRGDGDYFARVTIGNGPTRVSTDISDTFEGGDVQPNWHFTEMVEPGDFLDGLVPISIEIGDDDDPDANGVVDINPDPGETAITFPYDLASGSISGGSFGEDDGDGSAQIFYEVFIGQKVVATVTGFEQIDSPDFGDGNYRFDVKFGSQPEQSTGSSITYPPGFGTHSFAAYVNPANPVVKVRFSVVDVDDVFDDLMDVNPRDGVSRLTLDFDITTGRWAEEGGAFAWPENRSTGDGDDPRGRLHFDISVDGLDSDGDGLLDDWETNGIDVDGDSVIDFSPNSNPLHKDIFIEVDSMVGRAPMAGVLQDVVAAFAAAPNSLVNNPDGLNGVTVNILLDETNIPNASWAHDGTRDNWFGFDPIKANLDPNIPGGFGTVAERGSANAANILAAKRPFFRYAIFADRYGGNDSSGLSEIGGNDFFITMGSLWTNVTRNRQAGTFMHELGHTLGLRHGGGDDIHFKPNYPSIMNYNWQLQAPILASSTTQEIAFSTSWTLDYSRITANLDENALVDANGIGGRAGVTTRIGPRLSATGTVIPVSFVSESGAIDWDGNPATTSSSRDINFLEDGPDSGNAITTADASPGQFLAGFTDWSNLLYNFRLGEGYADGVHTADEPNELTFQSFYALADVLAYAAPSGEGAGNLTLRLNAGVLEVVDNETAVVVASRPLAQTRGVQIFGPAGESDTLTVDFKSGGHFTVPDGVTFDGGAGAGSDRLKIVGTGTTTGVYTPSATTPGDGTATVISGAQSVAIGFAGLEPVEVSGMAGYTLLTPNSADNLALSSVLNFGGQPAYAVNGTTGGIPIETLIVSDVAAFTIDAASNDGAGGGSSNDSISVTPGTGLTGVDHLYVSGGAGADAITVSAAGETTIHINGGADADVLKLAGDTLVFDVSGTAFTVPAGTRDPVTYENVETLSLFKGLFQATGLVAPAAVSANVVVDSGATLGGVGAVLGAVNVKSGGTVDPGVSGPGVLRTGNLNFSGGLGSAFNLQLNGLTPGSQHDQLRVVGAVNLAGAKVSATLGFTVIPGDELVVLRNDGIDAVVGKFGGAATGDIVTVGGKKFAVDYAFDGGDGGAAEPFNDVALIAYGAALAPDPCDPRKQALFVSATAGADIIRIVPVINGSSKVRVLINGIDEGTFQPSGQIIVFGQAGDDRISIEVPSRASWLYGQAGNDTLLSGNGDSILVGGLGDDRLTTGNGRDLLIGGGGADILDAGNGDDLLVAGATTYDANNAANRNALCQLQDEWLHGSGTYTGRIQHLRSGGGRNGSAVLNGVTVSNDSRADRLYGRQGSDWFLGSALDSTDRSGTEILTNI